MSLFTWTMVWGPTYMCTYGADEHSDRAVNHSLSNSNPRGSLAWEQSGIFV